MMIFYLRNKYSAVKGMTNHTILVFAHLAVGQAAHILRSVETISQIWKRFMLCCIVWCDMRAMSSILHFVSTAFLDYN